TSNRNRLVKNIKENFDANSEVKENRYNIIITSDVLAEGVNLHRSNVIVNYDSPWNATRLMQRIGRVNRIGSVADNIYNYMFYPSKQGDSE
ncbi:C-terminal helicase domain-containing protein, partial [Klebsiella pneumoniae]|uniref:C-terminal helicase domain-containing protein n=1 Tax=Klebsiella pneumoniae TaxID=573 RepID=UPI0025A2D1ED